MSDEIKFPVAENIEIFIITYNRSKLLAETFLSIQQQTIKPIKITIIDNGSSDETVEYCQKIAGNTTHVIRNERNIPGNEVFTQIASLVSKKYLIVFHDDDIMHPQYIAAVVRAIEINPSLTLLGSIFESFSEADNNSRDITEWLTRDLITTTHELTFKNQVELAAFFYAGHPFHFASAVYNSAIFKTLSLDIAHYGKICDRPFLLSFGARGSSLVFDQPFIKYRIHVSQDSADNKTGPFFSDLSNLQKLYCTLLTENALSSQQKVFFNNNWRYLQGDYNYLKASKKINISRIAYYIKQLQNGATTFKAIFIGLFQSSRNIFTDAFRHVKTEMRNGLHVLTEKSGNN
jgi:glycosyltransferase involved in cell wall biosynthesis